MSRSPAPSDDPPPVPPERPSRDDCCHSGCDPCIFDLYDAALARYEAELRAWQARQAAAGKRNTPCKARRRKR